MAGPMLPHALDLCALLGHIPRPGLSGGQLSLAAES